MRTMHWRTMSLVVAAFLLGAFAAGSGTLGAARLQGFGEAGLHLIARVVGLDDQRTPASANFLSEHEI